MKKVLSFFSKTVVIACVIIISLLLIFAITQTAQFTNVNSFDFSEFIEYVKDNIFINILLVILFLLIIGLLSYLTKNMKKSIIFILIFHLILGCVWVLISKSPLKADQKYIEIIAKQFLNNNFYALENGAYLYYHPHQLGFIMYIYWIYEFFGVNKIIPMMLNSVYSVITLFFLYKITKIIFNKEEVTANVRLFILLFFTLDLLATFFYGNIIGLMFGTISIYYLIKYIETNNDYNLIVLIITMILAIILKMNFLIYFIGLAIILIMNSIRNHSLRKFGIATLSIVFILIGCTIINGVLRYNIESRADKKFSRGVPASIYISMGMQEKESRPSGWFNNKYNGIINIPNNDYDIEKSDREAKEDIKNRIIYYINNPKDFVQYYKDKILSTWIEPTFQALWSNESMEETTIKHMNYIENNHFLNDMYNGKLNDLLIKYFDIYEITIFLLTIISLINNFKNFTLPKFSLILIFFGGFLFHIIWETKSLYVIPYFILLLPFAADGLEIMKGWIKKIIKKLKSKNKRKSKRVLALPS